ncbi:MAG: hypothetical protein ABI579_02730, partial [Candidatus Sumerlaeota bacterium]
LSQEIEIIGDGMRRARFTASPKMFKTPNAIATFRMESGGSAELLIVDGNANEPIAKAFIGPITPDVDAMPDMMRKSYPFYTRSDSIGRVKISGIIDGYHYRVPIHARGYERRIARVSAGTQSNENLRQGGAMITGTAIGARTGKPKGKIAIMLTGGPDDLDIRTSSDEEGKFIIGDLPPGDFALMSVNQAMGSGIPMSLKIQRGQNLENILLSINEGFSISGIAVDAEAGTPILGVKITVQNQTTLTNPSGEFQFELVDGPWPPHFSASYEGYALEAPDGLWPSMTDQVKDVRLSFRKQRFIEFVPEWNEAILAAQRNAMGQVLRVAADSKLSDGSTMRGIVGQGSISYPHKGTGLYLGWARNSSGFASDMIPLRISQTDTTITLPLAMDKGATIRGSLSYADGDPKPVYTVQLKKEMDGISVACFSISPKTDGTFEESALPPGVFTAEFVSRDGSILLSRQIELKRDTTTELNEQISRGNILAGIVVDPDGNPQQEIELEIFGTDRLKTVAGSDGTFRFENLKGDVIDQLRVNHHQWTNEPIVHIPIPDEHYIVTLKQRGAINVEVRASGGALERASVVLMQGTQRTSAMASGQWYYDEDKREALLGKSAATFTPAASGHYRVALQADGAWTVSPSFDWTGDKDGGRKSMTLIAGDHGSLVINAKDMDDAALNALDISLVNTSLPAEAPSEFESSRRGSGRVSFDAIPTGEYLLVVSRDTGEFVSKTNLSLDAGETKTVDVTFAGELATLTGELHAVSASGDPIPDVEVKVFYGDIPEPPLLASTQTNSAGEFSFDLLQSERPYLLVFKSAGRTKQVVTPKLSSENNPKRIVLWENPVALHFNISPELVAKLRANSVASIMVTDAEGMTSLPIPLDQIQNDQALEPGNYSARAGELFLGTFNVVSSNRKLEITLTEQTAP